MLMISPAFRKDGALVHEIVSNFNGHIVRMSIPENGVIGKPLRNVRIYVDDVLSQSFKSGSRIRVEFDAPVSAFVLLCVRDDECECELVWEG